MGNWTAAACYPTPGRQDYEDGETRERSGDQDHPSGQDLIGTAPPQLFEGPGGGPRRSTRQRSRHCVARQRDLEHRDKGHIDAASAKEPALETGEGCHRRQLEDYRYQQPAQVEVRQHPTGVRNLGAVLVGAPDRKDRNRRGEGSL